MKTEFVLGFIVGAIVAGLAVESANVETFQPSSYPAAQSRAALDTVIRVWNAEGVVNRLPVDEIIGVLRVESDLCAAADDGNMGCPK